MKLPHNRLVHWTGELMAWAVGHSEVYSDPVYCPAPPRWRRVPVWFVLLTARVHSRLLWRHMVKRDGLGP